MSLERLERTPFAVLIAEILSDRMTGALTIVQQPVRRVVYFSQGDVALVVSSVPDESLPEYLLRMSLITPEQASSLTMDEPTDVVRKFYELKLGEGTGKQTLVRDWIASLFIPMFSLEEGSAFFSSEEGLPPAKRAFIPSTGALIVEGVRSISNGLILRRSLGDIKRQIVRDSTGQHVPERLPLSDAERRIANSLGEPEPIESFLKRFPADSTTAAKVVITMMILGVFRVHEARQTASGDTDETQRDLMLLASIGSDPQAIKIIKLARQLSQMDFYEFLEVPRAATRAQITTKIDEMKARYNPASYSPAVREPVLAILAKIDEAAHALKDSIKRQEYDKLVAKAGHQGPTQSDKSIQQQLARRSIAQQNYAKAQDLAIAGDYYGAIVLLKQTVEYEPSHAGAWFLLASCQERNPKWKRDAIDNFQRALSVDPNHVEAMISLGDLYKAEGLASRAQACYEDVIKIEPENAQAKSRLKALKGK